MRAGAVSFFICLALLIPPDAAAGQTPEPPALPDGQRDFDWEIGAWRTELSLLLNPLTDSARWVAFEGTTVVRQLWDGAANLADGRPVHVRFEIAQVSAEMWRFEQAFSGDGGRTWEVNWIAVDTRVAAGVQ